MYSIIIILNNASNSLNTFTANRHLCTHAKSDHVFKPKKMPIVEIIVLQAYRCHIIAFAVVLNFRPRSASLVLELKFSFC